MATGIQTGMRTGSSPMPTGARGGAPTGGNSPMQKITQTISAMSPKQKIIGGIAVGLLLVAIISFAMISKSSEYVQLYDTKLTERDVKDIGDRLTQMGIAYKVESGTNAIFVSPASKSSAKMKLYEYGLPRRALKDPSESAGGLMPVTPKQQDAIAIEKLKVEMTENVRQIQGVADAVVTIVVPKEDYFAQDKKSATASVMILPQPGVQLTTSQVKGICNMLAFSVEGLRPENVMVIDDKGFSLSDKIVWNADDPSVMASEGTGKKVAYEQELQKKVQGMLDSTLGPNKARVVVNATLDFSTKVRESKVVGGAGNTTGEVVSKGKTITETYTSDPNSGAKDSGVAQMSISMKGGDSSNYQKKEEVVMKDHNVTVTKTSTPAGTVQRLSASVMVDNLKADQVANVEKLVKDAIGIDETRGDSVTVVSIPFAHSETTLADMHNTLIANQGNTPASQINVKAVTPGLAIAAVVIMMMVAMVYVLRQKGVQTDRTKLILSGGNTATSSDISDLVSDKIGRSTLPADTKVNTSEQLEKLAKEKPTKVAELLKSTWLADKER